MNKEIRIEAGNVTYVQDSYGDVWILDNQQEGVSA